MLQHQLSSTVFNVLQQALQNQPTVDDRFCAIRPVCDTSLSWTVAGSNVSTTGWSSQPHQTWKIVGCRSAQVTDTTPAHKLFMPSCKWDLLCCAELQQRPSQQVQCELQCKPPICCIDMLPWSAFKHACNLPENKAESLHKACCDLA